MVKAVSDKFRKWYKIRWIRNPNYDWIHVHSFDGGKFTKWKEQRMTSIIWLIVLVSMIHSWRTRGGGWGDVHILRFTVYPSYTRVMLKLLTYIQVFLPQKKAKCINACWTKMRGSTFRPCCKWIILITGTIIRVRSPCSSFPAWINHLQRLNNGSTVSRKSLKLIYKNLKKTRPASNVSQYIHVLSILILQGTHSAQELRQHWHFHHNKALLCVSNTVM